MATLRFWKPFGVLTQFTDASGRPTLADYISQQGVYPAGRLDLDSEGLLILTSDGVLQARLTQPKFGHRKVYLAQVEGVPTDEAIRSLSSGVTLSDGPTLPAKVQKVEAPDLPERSVPIRIRKSIPTSWLRLEITEGRNRQVRRMTAAVGFPTLRLVRIASGPIDLNGLQPGKWQELSVEEVAKLYKSTGSR